VLVVLGGLKQTDFSLVAVFAALFIGVEGLRRSPLARLLDPTLALGQSAQGLSVSGALLAQVVSNVPAALLLAPAAASSSDPRAFTGLLYGVNAGGSGTPIASLASLIGARIYLADRRHRGRFWRVFFAVSGTLLAVGIALSLALLKYSAGSR
jgi:Na+/H+ antiporter NhaD/arsenite permease-like protein